MNSFQERDDNEVLGGRFVISLMQKYHPKAFGCLPRSHIQEKIQFIALKEAFAASEPNQKRAVQEEPVTKAHRNACSCPNSRRNSNQ